MKSQNYTGMNLREAIRYACLLGCDISRPNRTGEILVAYPGLRKRCRVNARRKDASRALVAYLRRVTLASV